MKPDWTFRRGLANAADTIPWQHLAPTLERGYPNKPLRTPPFAPQDFTPLAVVGWRGSGGRLAGRGNQGA